MVGFFEFSLMRVSGDIDQKALSEPYDQYLNVEEDFIKALFLDGQTPLGRVFVQEPALSTDNGLHVLDYECAGEVIRTVSHIGVSLCYFRHKMAHVGRDCNAPKEICMTFNTAAASLIWYGHALPVDAGECRDLLDQAHDENLVQFGENVQHSVNFIRNCWGCCCEAMQATQRFGLSGPGDKRWRRSGGDRWGRVSGLWGVRSQLCRHRTLAAVLGVILELDAVKSILASRLLQSRYVDASWIGSLQNGAGRQLTGICNRRPHRPSNEKRGSSKRAAWIYDLSKVDNTDRYRVEGGSNNVSWADKNKTTKGRSVKCPRKP